MRREHFKVVYERNPGDLRVNPEAGGAIFNALAAEFGAENFRRDRYHQESGATDFPVRLRSGELVSSLDRSTTLARVPVVSVDYVFADRSTVDKADKWLTTHRAHIIEPKAEGMSNG